MRFSKQNLSRTFILFISLFAGSFVFGQDPIIVNITLLPPYPNYADEVMNMGDQTIISLQNTDFNSTFSLKMGVELSGGNGIIVRSKESAMPNQEISLGPGESLVLTGEDLSDFYNNFSESDFDFIGITQEEIINDQQLPDGSYTVCVRAYDYNSGIPLSSSSPLGCTAPFTVVAVDPPMITYPQNDQVISPIEPQLLNINWIPVSVSLPDLRYRIEMVDLTDMPMNPYDAFLTGDFLSFYEEDIFSNSFFYGMEYPLLEEGHKYAVRVRAYRLDGLLNVNNEGYSDIVSFNYGDVPPDEEDGNDGLDEFNTTSLYVPPPLPDQSLNCGNDCYFDLQGTISSGTTTPVQGTMLNFGKFQMLVSSIQGSGTYNGTGIIQASGYIPVGIKVDFSGVKVDSNGRVFAGQAKATIRQNSWIDETWADIQTATSDIHFTNPSSAYNALTDENYYIDNLSALYQEVGTSIPISIGEEEHSLQIVGMNFFPDRASFNLSYMERLDDDPSGARYLHFMAKDLCLTPGGPALSADEAQLELVKPLNYTFDQSTRLTFQPASSLQIGSYLSFDCNGFVGIHATGDVRFDPDVFKAVNSEGTIQQGDTVVASFVCNFIDWSDWLAFVSFENDEANGNNGSSEHLFIYKELQDYIIRVGNAVIDHSISSNLSTMVFPENYNAAGGPEWQGFYIESLRIDLPKWMKVYGDSNERVKLFGSDLIVDSDGLTGLIQASKVLSSEKGAMGKWPLTIDSVSVNIQQNTLVQAYFSGGLKIPVIDEAFDYTADIQFLGNNTKHTFSFSPIDSYNFSTWFAEATLENNSYLEVTVGSNSAFVEANLNGKLSFAPIIGDIDKSSLTDITFENMIIRSAKNPKYIEIGEIGTGVNAATLAVAGFGVVLESLEWDEDALENAGLAVGVGLDLAGGINAISGGTELFIKNKIESFADSISFTHTGTEIKEIHLEVETGAVDFKGTINFFKNDVKFGSGFQGDIELAFIKTIKIDGTVLFGNKIESNDKINYWYAFAMVYLPNSPVPMATPLDVYGFGGGVYYNMAINQDFPNPSAIGGSMVDPKTAFNVAKGFAGIQASVVTALTPSSRTFNADVTLTAEINLNTGGLNMISLTGAGYVMQDLEASNKDEAMVSATVAIMYDFPNETFSAQFGLIGNIPKEQPLLNIDGDINFYRSPTLWYFKAGIPSDKLTTTIDLGLAGINAGAYFMTGMQLPPPELPSQVDAFFNFNSSMVNNTQNGMGIGFMAGVHLDMNVDLTALGTGIQITAMAGVDIAVLNYFAATCNGSEDFGINKWYAQGQGYIYGEFVLEAFTADVASLELGIILEGAFPNPTGVKGIVKAEAEFLVFETSIEEPFSIGSFCDIQPMANAGQLVERKELELENMDLIGVLTPENGGKNVSVGAKPSIQWFKENDSHKRYVYGDGLGGIVDKLYRFRNESKWQKQAESGNGWNNINYSTDLDETENITSFTAENASGNPSLLHGNAVYKIRARSYIEQFDGSPSMYYSSQQYANSHPWIAAKYLEGPNKNKPIEEIVEHQFTTQSNLTEIEELFVDYTLPYPRQRFYPYGYLASGEIDFNVDHEPKFQDFEACGFELHAEFEAINGSGSAQIVEVTRQNLMQVNFDMASLSPQTIYKLIIVAEREISPQDLANETNDNCKVNDVQNLNDFMENNGLQVNMENYTVPLGNMMNMGPAYQTNFSSSFNNGGEKIIQRKILYTIYFRTSKFATPQEKLNSMTVAEVTMKPILVYNVYPIYLKDAKIAINCAEGFDKYDILGHDYAASETMEYFRPYGPGCNTEGMGAAVQNWYNNTCATLYGFGSNPNGNFGNGSGSFGNDQFAQAAQMAQQLADGQPGLWEVYYTSDPANYTGIKYIKPLLSDVEVGLAEAEEYVYTPPATTTSQSSSSSTNFGSFGSSSYTNYSMEGQNQQGSNTTIPLINVTNEPELELLYKPDRTAYYMLNFLQSNSFYSIDPNLNHVRPPSGNYPISIGLANTNFDANESLVPAIAKTFSILIPF